MAGNGGSGQGPSGNRSNQRLIRAVVGAIAVAAVGLLVAGILRERGGREDPWVARFQCLNPNCRHEWEPTAEKLAGSPGMLLSPRVRCPKCGANTGVQMSQCPRCKGFYVSARKMNPRAPFSAELMRNVCPNCKTDIVQWQKQRRENEAR